MSSGRLVTQPHRGRTLYRFFLTVVCSGLSIYAGFCLLWGVNYYADSFQQQSGIYARSCTVEELEAVTADFARQLAQAADNVQRTRMAALPCPAGDLRRRHVGVRPLL